MKIYSANAYAKINLSLDVTEKLHSGYHSVKMLMHQIPLWDKIYLSHSENGKISVTSDKDFVPVDERNTVYKASELFFDRIKKEPHIKIHIQKNIPLAAGLAGGSSDAAVTLKLLNKMHGSPLSFDDMMALSLMVGADVPFCFMGGCALSEGIGEILTPVSTLRNAYIVLAKPPVDISTKWVYENLHLEEITKHPDTDAVIKAIKTQNLSLLSESSSNVLETVTAKKYPVISFYKDILGRCDADFTLMSGSGPSVFGIFSSKFKAYSTYKKMLNLTKDAFILKI